MSDTLADPSINSGLDIWTDRRVKIGYETAEELAKRYNEANWRGHPESQADALDESLDALGWVGSIKINLQTGKIFDGHLRVERALLKDPALQIPVDYYDLSPDEEALALQIHDAITEQAQPIADKLAALMERTKHLMADKPGLAAMLEQLKVRAGVNGHQPIRDIEPQIDKAAQLAEQWGTRVGQVWELGKHRLVCGDCTDRATVEAVMKGERADCIIADAPYGMNLNTHYKRGNTGEYNGVTDTNRNNYSAVIGDDEDFDPRPVMKLLDCKEQFWFGADYYAERIPDKNDGSWLVWDKRAGIEEIDFSLSEFELVWSKKKRTRRIIRVKWFGIQGMEKQDTKKRIHPTQKPLELIAQLLGLTQGCKTILDPFLGSGTTLIACENLNRHCRAIEIDPGYCAVSIQRWVDLTGQQPRLISG